MAGLELIRRQADAKQDVIDEYLTIFRYFTPKDDDRLDLVGARLHGPHPERVNRRSSKLYFVLAGTLSVTIDGRHSELRRHDAVLIPPGSWHALDGQEAEILIVVAPPYNPADESLRG
jgi:mannose-6-phosphate isomerase-like protein (cupin superfamily)